MAAGFQVEVHSTDQEKESETSSRQEDTGRAAQEEGIDLELGEARLIAVDLKAKEDRRAARQQLTESCSLDDVSASFQAEVEQADLEGRPVASALSGLFTALRESKDSQISFEFVREYLSLAADNPSAQIAGLKLLASRTDINVPPAFIRQMINNSNPKVSAAAISLLANSESELSFDQALEFVSNEENPFTTTDMRQAYQFAQQLFGGSEPSQEAARTEQLAAVISLIADRSDIPLPDNLFERIDSLRPRPSVSRIAGLEMGIGRTPLFFNPRGKENTEFEAAVLTLIESREPPGSLDYLREHYLTPDKPGASVALEIIKNSENLFAQYGLEQMLEDRNHWLDRHPRHPGFAGAEAWNDDRFGSLLAQKIFQAEGNTISQEMLESIKMPILNRLYDLSNSDPLLIEHLRKHHPQPHLLLARAIAQEIVDERKELVDSNREIFGPDTRMLMLFHEEPRFFENVSQRFVEEFGVDLIGTYKGSNDPSLTEVRKRQALGEIKKMAADLQNHNLIYAFMHGGPHHIALTNFQAGSEVSDDLERPGAISYRELALALVDGQSELEGQVDLSHMTIVLDACRQHEFAENLRDEIISLANERKLELKGLPLVVSASQRNAYGFSSSMSDSVLMRAIETVDREDGKPFTIEHLMEADSYLNSRIRFTNELDSNGRPPNDYHIGEDLGIFSPNLTSLGNLNSLVEAIAAAEGREINLQQLEEMAETFQRAIDSYLGLFREAVEQKQQEHGELELELKLPRAREYFQGLEVGATERGNDDRRES